MSERQLYSVYLDIFEASSIYSLNFYHWCSRCFRAGYGPWSDSQRVSYCKLVSQKCILSNTYILLTPLSVLHFILTFGCIICYLWQSSKIRHISFYFLLVGRLTTMYCIPLASNLIFIKFYFFQAELMCVSQWIAVKVPY